MVTQAGGFCGLKEGLAGGANFGGKNLQYFERKCGLRVHDREEIGAADETYLRFGTGNRTERVRLITDERWKAEHGTRHRLDGEDGSSIVGIHGEFDCALLEEVNAIGRRVLLEEKTICITRDGGRPFLKGLNQLRIGDKC